MKTSKYLIWDNGSEINSIYPQTLNTASGRSREGPMVTNRRFAVSDKKCVWVVILLSLPSVQYPDLCSIATYNIKTIHYSWKCIFREYHINFASYDKQNWLLLPGHSDPLRPVGSTLGLCVMDVAVSVHLQFI